MGNAGLKAVMYGAGNIGRGFIGATLGSAGYQVTFIDVADRVVDAINSAGQYPVRVVSGEDCEEIIIAGVNAVHGNDTEKVAQKIAEADIIALSVGVKALKFIAPNLAAGLRMRFAVTDRPLDILICENLMDAQAVLEKLLKAQLMPEEQAIFDRQVGLVETSIGRMVPVQTPEMQDGNPLRVCVERYCYLPADKDAFKGPAPVIDQLILASPFSFYIKRKLYIHNMGHAICAYLGLYSGIEYICDAIENPQIHLIAKYAMTESAEALAAAYGYELTPLLRHVDDLIYRFCNRALKDTCARVGQDSKRKLAPEDRLIGSANMCMEQGITPVYISLGVAGAVYNLLAQTGGNQNAEQASYVLKSVSSLGENSEWIQIIMDSYNMYLNKSSLGAMQKHAQKRKCDSLAHTV